MLKGARQQDRFSEETMTGRQKVLHLKQPLGTFVQEVDEVTQKDLEIWKCHNVYWCELTHLVRETKTEFLTTMFHCSDRITSVH